ncbi:TetR/AcrR family transcriptional regulator [Tritonibacter aquimaris]
MEKILEVTRAMLAAGPAHQITTIHIAERAVISIGSLYRFFPNKEAIFYELFRLWLEQTLETLDSVQENLSEDATQQDCVEAFLTALTQPGLNSLQNWKLRLAMGTTPELVELEEKHLREVLVRVNALQQRFGTPPPPDMAPEVMVMQNEITVRCLYTMAYLEQSPNRDHMFQLAKKLLLLIYDFPRWDGLEPH